ncbi:MAG TPA: deoxyribose-phosphate aldolase [Ferruginibacter sp.]|nr:deoxyribose-phosphate aldolase [Ferruginibacter sp.]HRO05040.1 deoxyribose-phosphate aldolase [Ferruginibacter sp.]HRO95655.1 deoxyribose-phosphate aldolase [Ferruginibacter sp.]HRP49486.1 deoxyribose-phosphate aldolase [Ferruginibacter sp.]
MNIAGYIDHTILKPTTLLAEVEQLCKEAVEHQFAAVCVPPMFVKHAKTFTAGSGVEVATVIGFPFGYSAIEAKVAETALAIVDGADELDMVINIAALKNNDWQYLVKEINTIMPLIQQKNRVLKVIIESGVLTDEEIIRCCEIYGLAGVHYMKTSTGYAEKGASTHAVKLMRAHLPEHIKIKASGGIRTYDFAKELIDAGANRIGCSGSVKIMEEAARASGE